MLLLIQTIFSAAAAAAVTWHATVQLSARATLRRRNYRGLEIPTATGIAVLLGILSGLALAALVSGATEDPRVDLAAAHGRIMVAAAAGFALLGLWDDLTGSDAERGWRAHVRALLHGRATGGAIKLLGGGALALVVAAARGEGVAWLLADAALLALSANLLNLLDVRPGRAAKAFLLAIVPLAFAALIVGEEQIVPGALAAAAAAAAFLSFDLRERAMLGDVGANALGAVLGYALLAAGSHVVRGAALLVLIALHTVADKPGLSRLIAAVTPLRRLDATGRVPE